MSRTIVPPLRTLSLPPRIGIFLIPTDPFWIQVREAILYTNQSFGDDLIVLQPAISNQALDSIPPDQVLDLVLAQELDALICATGSMALVEALIKEKLPVICLDESDLRYAGLSVASSLYPGGKIAGEYIARKLSGKGHSVCISAGQEKTITLGQSRFAGFRDGLAPYSDITIGHIPVFWRYDQAYPMLLDALENYPCPIHAIFGVSDTLILAARDAGRKLGIINHETVLVGLNGDPLALAAIAEGSLSATVDTAAAGLGSRAMQIAHQAAMGLPQPPIVEHQFHLITRENIASVATQKLIEIANLPTQMVGYSRQKENERLSQLEISTEITRQIGSLRERDRVAEIVAKSVRQHYGYEWLRILRWSEQDRTLVLFGGDLSPASQRVPIDQDWLVQDAFRSNQVFLIQDTHTSHRWHVEKEFELIRSRAVLPIQLGDKVIGVLDLQSASPLRQPSLEIVGLKLLASQLGIVIQNFELYQEALLARQAAENANQLKTRLIANVGHEMRTPLNTILGFSQSIQKQMGNDGSIPPENLARDIDHVYKSGEHLMYMINDLLDLSRAEIGALSLYFETLPPTPFLEELFCDFSQSDSVSPLVQWTLDVPRHLPLIRADIVRLRQILINLLANARKFTHAGSVTLGAAVEAPYLRLWVRDTGQGIPTELQEKIFEPFGTTGLKRRPEGIGLGLSITRHLVALHGGTITLESHLGTGSTFNIYLPLPGVSQETARSLSAEYLNVMLVVSNRAHVPDDIRQICERQALVPVPIATREDLDAALAEGRPRAIAWDLAHANSKEWSLIHRINSNPDCAALPFLLFSTTENDGGKDVEKDTSLTQVVFKPCPANTLQDWISQLSPDRESTGSILIVDDDADCRAYYQKLLGNNPLQKRVILADGGKQALEILDAETPALILLDLVMPEVDGFAVLEAVRGNARTRSVPVIIISGKLLNYEDIQRLNHFKTLFATKDILTERETSDFLDQLIDEPGLLPQPTSMLIKQALGYLHQNFAQPIHRQDIASAVGVNPHYLTRIFRQEMRLTPLDYLNRLRIRKAKELLCQTQETVTNIATQVGFDDAAYFSRVFHRLTGQTPQKFRHSN